MKNANEVYLCMVETDNRILTIVSKNKNLNDNEKVLIEEQYGKILHISNNVGSDKGIFINFNDTIDIIELKQIIQNIKELNPYPSNIFLEPSDEDWKEIGKFLAEHGKNPDRIFAKFGRMVWQNCVNCMEDYLPS